MRVRCHGTWRAQMLPFGISFNLTSNSMVTSFFSLSVPKKPEYGVMPKSVWRTVALPRYWPETGLMTWSRTGCDLPFRGRVPSIAPLADGPGGEDGTPLAGA